MTVKSKTIALAATALAAVIGLGAAVAQTALPSIAAPKPSEGRTLAHANGYSVTVPGDWLVATDVEGVDFMMGNPDLSVICQTFSEKDVITMSDDDIKAQLGTVDLGQEFFTKLIFGGAPELAYESTGPQPDHPSGWPFQRAVATALLDNVKNTAHAFITFKAKSAIYGFCYTATTSIDANKAAMNGIIDAITLAK